LLGLFICRCWFPGLLVRILLPWFVYLLVCCLFVVFVLVSLIMFMCLCVLLYMFVSLVMFL